jgi:phage gp36-like protein
MKCERALLFMYDESLDYMYSIPIELDVKKPPSLGVDCIKLHSNRGMVG